MKMFLLIASVCVTLDTTMPASAQMYPDAGLNRLEDFKLRLEPPR